jgi:4-hydroxybenzoate polyprenyltransferase
LKIDNKFGFVYLTEKRSMQKTLIHFADLIKLQHTLFALPFALISAILAWKMTDSFHWVHLAGIVICMVTARSAAMAFNRLIDSTYDAENPRTALRHIPAGLIKKNHVLAFVIINSLAFLISCSLFLIVDNPWPLVFGLPVLLFLLAYSYAKRFTSLCHFWLGLALALSPIGAWVAIRGMAWSESPIPLMLTGAVFFWVSGFDMLYACQDEAFDKAKGLFSVPARIGLRNTLRLAFLCHIAMIVFLLGFYWLASPTLGNIYLGGVMIVTCLVVYQHSLVNENDLSKVNQAFFNVNAIISVGLLLVVILQICLD